MNPTADIAQDSPVAWRRVMDAVEAALEIAADARIHWMRASSGLAPAEMRMAEEMLAHAERIERLDASGEASDVMRFIPELLDEVPAATGGTGRLAPGVQLGRFTVVRLLGSGGMGEVYECRDETLGQVVAVKTLPAHASSMRERRLAREAAAMARLDHPSIARLVDWGVASHDGGEIGYIAMELVEGESLPDACARIRAGAPGDPWPVVQLLLPVVDAVAHAHARGVIHRDIKPSNVMVDRSGHARLLDFGVALLADRGIEAAKTLTDEFARPGTLAYMSPEQVSGADSRGTTRSDIRALALVMLESINGERVVRTEGVGLAEVVEQVARGEPPPPRTARSGRNSALAAVLRKALRQDPAERYQSAAEFAEDLRRVRSGMPPLGVRLRGFDAARAALWRHRRAATIAVVCVAAAGAAGSMVLSQYLRARDAETRIKTIVSELMEGSAPMVIGLPKRLAAANESLNARVAASEAALEYLAWLEQRSAGDPRAVLQIARSLRQLAVITGSGGAGSRGETESAIEMLKRSIAMLDTLIAERSTAELLEERALAWSTLGTTLPGEERADAMTRAATGIGAAARMQKDPQDRQRLLVDAAMLSAYSARAAEDTPALERAAAQLRELAGPSASAAMLAQVGMIDRQLADQMLNEGDVQGALRAATTARDTILQSIAAGEDGFSNQRHLAFVEMMLVGLSAQGDGHATGPGAMDLLEAGLARSRRLLDELPADNFRRVSHAEAVAVFAQHATAIAEHQGPEAALRALARIADERAALDRIPDGTVPHRREPVYQQSIEASCRALRAIAAR
ncbi:MAG: serine/threonine protein kinase [Phycisphaerales bacterium]|nr:serine/threonine protein kinase [Phycisphaerales bacterium]